LTFQVKSSRKTRKIRSSNGNSSEAAVLLNQESYVRLLPQVIGYRIGNQAQSEILTFGGQIRVEDFWSTEALIDELEDHIVQVRDQQQHLSTSFSNTRKYLHRAIEVITNWSKVEQTQQPHQFIFNLSDILRIDQRLAAELVDLDRTTPSTLAYVLHEVVKRLFGMVSAHWFYESAAEEIEVVIQP
jgi:hypothetical protein